MRFALKWPCIYIKTLLYKRTLCPGVNSKFEGERTREIKGRSDLICLFSNHIP